MENPTASGIPRRDDGSIGNRDDALSASKLAGCPESDITARYFPLKHDKNLEGSIIGVAAIGLELVSLNGNLVLSSAGIRAREASLDKLDVGIRVIDPDRGRAAALTYLFDSQCGLVLVRVCGSHLFSAASRIPHDNDLVEQDEEV